MDPAVASAPDRYGLVGTELEDKFRIDRVVARGGFGIVYAAHHTRLNTPVAVKVLKTPEDLSPAAHREFYDRFLLEAQTMARIKHPAIVQVLDTGVSPMPSGDTAPWMVLEWLTGKTLKSAFLPRRRAGTPLAAADAVAVLRPVFEALAYVHDEGVAHRDVKPENIMLVRLKRGHATKLLDFGIAKVMERDERALSLATMTRSAMAAFSPGYAAPEQVGGTRSGPWTDVHALALVLTELMTGKMVYDRTSVVTMYNAALSSARPTPKHFGVDVGPLEDVLARAMALRADARWRNATEFLDAIDQVLPRSTNPDPLGFVAEGALPLRPSADHPWAVGGAVTDPPPPAAPSDVLHSGVVAAGTGADHALPDMLTVSARPSSLRLPAAAPLPRLDTATTTAPTVSLPAPTPPAGPRRTARPVLLGLFFVLAGLGGVGAAFLQRSLFGTQPLDIRAIPHTVMPVQRPPAQPLSEQVPGVAVQVAPAPPAPPAPQGTAPAPEGVPSAAPQPERASPGVNGDAAAAGPAPALEVHAPAVAPEVPPPVPNAPTAPAPEATAPAAPPAEAADPRPHRHHTRRDVMFSPFGAAQSGARYRAP